MDKGHSNDCVFALKFTIFYPGLFSKLLSIDLSTIWVMSEVARSVAAVHHIREKLQDFPNGQIALLFTRCQTNHRDRNLTRVNKKTDDIMSRFIMV